MKLLAPLALIIALGYLLAFAFLLAALAERAPVY